jgi:glutamine cyclotransferase
MRSQTRSRLIIVGLALAAIVLVISLLMSQQRSRLPAAVDSPLADALSTAVSADEDAEQLAVSPLAAPESPLTSSATGSSAMAAALPATSTTAVTETVAVTETAIMTESQIESPPVAMTATSTVTVTLVASQPQIYDYQVIESYPHDPEAFTQGLQYVNGVLYEGTGLNGHSSLRRVDLETGTVEQQIDLADQYFGEGIVVIEDRIYQLTWQSQVAFLYDRESFELLDEFNYPTEGWGLTYDGEELIMSDGSSTLFRRDAETFEELAQIEVNDRGDSINLLNELEYIEGEVWANIWQTDQIAIIDPADGDVRAWVDLTGLLPSEERANADVLNGIAYDDENDRIFVTGKFWPTIFEIELVPR